MMETAIDHLYAYTGATCREQRLQVDEGVNLRVLHFRPENVSPYPPLVMVTGLATVIESFRGILGALTRHFEVYYVETREKSSSRITGKVRYDIGTIGGEIASVIRQTGMQHGQYILFGYSFGATVITQAFRHLEERPRCLLLLSPTPVFNYPWWSLPLVRLGVPLYPVLKPIAKWYLRRVAINSREDGEMYRISSRTLDRADPRKLRNAILAIAGYKVWEHLDTVDCPALIVDTSMDGLHVHEDVMRMKAAIQNCTYMDLENNTRTHSAELAAVIRTYIDKLDGFINVN